MGTNHGHIEAALLTIALLAGIHGAARLFSWNMPPTLAGLPATLVLAVCIYPPLYLFLRRQWK